MAVRTTLAAIKTILEAHRTIMADKALNKPTLVPIKAETLEAAVKTTMAVLNRQTLAPIKVETMAVVKTTLEAHRTTTAVPDKITMARITTAAVLNRQTSVPTKVATSVEVKTTMVALNRQILVPIKAIKAIQATHPLNTEVVVASKRRAPLL